MGRNKNIILCLKYKVYNLRHKCFATSVQPSRLIIGINFYIQDDRTREFVFLNAENTLCKRKVVFKGRCETRF